MTCTLKVSLVDEIKQGHLLYQGFGESGLIVRMILLVKEGLSLVMRLDEDAIVFQREIDRNSILTTQQCPALLQGKEAVLF